MAKFITRRLLLMLLTMLVVSIAVFAITEAAPGNVARNVLGIHITPEQEASFLAQTGLDKPIPERYLSWLIGTDWRAANKLGMPVRQITTEDGFKEWWAVEGDGTLIRWKLEGEDLIARRLQPDGGVEETVDNGRWQVKDLAVEIERLEAYRAELLQNANLTQADRQAILSELDRILEILRQADQDQEALLAALAEPEQTLTELVDAEASRKKEALQQAGKELSNKDELLQAMAVYQELSTTPAGDLKPSDIQGMARRVKKAADRLEDIDPTLAAQLLQASESLQAEDLPAAMETLAGATEGISQLTAPVADLAQALQAQDYEAAAAALRDLSDPSITSFEAARLAIIPAQLKKIRKPMSDADPELGDAVKQAYETLEAGDIEAARGFFAQAATSLEETGQAIAISDAASGARVVRTFWGIDTENHAVRWEKGTGEEVWVFIIGTGWKSFTGGPAEYIPLQKGLLRGDPGISLRTGRPVADLLFVRLRNSLVLALIAFIIVMPLALVLGLLAGLHEGKFLDRVFSIGGMLFSVAPEFATGIFLILIFAFWLAWVPGATVFGEKAPWTRPDMLILPVLTLTLIELGYVLRITRASMVEVMKAPYIRTAFLKGLPYWRVVTKHAVRNALMAPITVIMLHVNWLLGGIVVVEVIFGYPGLGSYLLDSALFKDFNAIEAGAIILVAVAVGTQLLADIIYTFLNPRIRYA